MESLNKLLQRLTQVFVSLFHRTMTARAQRLPIAPVPEQRLVSPMGLDVVNKGRISPTHGAARMKAQELGPCLLPFPRVAALAAVGSGAVIAPLAFKLASFLTGTQDAMRDDSTAGTETRRPSHCGAPSGPEARHGQNQDQGQRLCWLGVARGRKHLKVSRWNRASSSPAGRYGPETRPRSR